MRLGSIDMINGFNANNSFNVAQKSDEKTKFSALISEIKNKNESHAIEKGRINGDYTTGFSGTFSGESNKNAAPVGFAANQSNGVQNRKIDKTSELYEKSMELENYFVKQMLSAMRKTVSKSAFGGDDFASQMYEDMLFDEYSVSMTKNAGFGLADQIYLSLEKNV